MKRMAVPKHVIIRERRLDQLIGYAIGGTIVALATLIVLQYP